MNLTRVCLYDLVWSKPMTKLAYELGISDRGLTKICKRYKIPIPGIGYWAKVQACHKTIKIPLSPLYSHNPEQIVFTCRKTKVIEDRYGKAVEAAVLFEMDKQNRIVVQNDTVVTHSITVKIQGKLSVKPGKMLALIRF